VCWRRAEGDGQSLESPALGQTRARPGSGAAVVRCDGTEGEGLLYRNSAQQKAAPRAALDRRLCARRSTCRQPSQDKTQSEGGTDSLKGPFLDPRFRGINGPAWCFSHPAGLVGKTVSHVAGTAGQLVDAFVRGGRSAVHRAAGRLSHLVDAAVKRCSGRFDAALQGVASTGCCARRRCGFVHDASFKKIPQNISVTCVSAMAGVWPSRRVCRH
jgi:hypothetical protein